MASYSKWVEASPAETVVEVTVRSLRSRLDPVLEFLPLTAERPQDDVEYVHRVRVWSRRAVAAIDLYRDLLPKRRRKWLRQQLNRIRRSANNARDDDVFALRLDAMRDQAGTNHLLEKVNDHRRRSQIPIVAIYEELANGDLLARRVAKLLKKVRLRADGQPVHFRKWAKRRFRREMDTFFQAASGDLRDVRILHQFRIAGKRLRYAAELLTSAFSDSLRDDIYPVIEDLQDRLGQINDHATAQDRLNRWTDQADAEDERDCLREMLAQEQRQLTESHAAFFQWWSSDRESKLRKTLEELMM
jgi:CHAD domain-containing protein